jgi:predicted transposase/invertase (TIGR01784 family)
MSKKKYNKQIEEIVDNLTLFDDQFMTRVFDQNKPATKRLISTILDKQVEIASVVGRDNLNNPVVKGRGVELDILAKDINGDYFNVEVQNEVSKASPQRARYYSATVDVRMLKEGEDFKEIKDSYVIFICKKDKFKRGKPIYMIERTFLDTNESFNDGNHIIYVNGEYEGEDAIGKLIHDLKCKDYKEMYYPELKEGVKHFKAKEGKEEMCESIENYAKQYASKERKEGEIKAKQAKQEGIAEGELKGIKMIIGLIKDKMITIEDAAERLDMSVEQLKKYMK